LKAPSLSIRARLTLWHASVLAVVILVFSAGTFFSAWLWLYHDLDRRLASDMTTVAAAHRMGTQELGELETQVGMTLFEVAQKGRVLYQATGWKQGQLALAMPPGETGVRTWTGPDGLVYRVARAPGPEYQITVARHERVVRDALKSLAIILSAGVPIAIGIALAGGYLLAGRVLSPIGAMADKARMISADSLAERLPTGNPRDEFGRLAGVINEALARVQGSFDQLRRFTADASHELRTPLTAMRSVGEVALHRPLDPDAYRNVIGSMLEEVEHLTRVVESLLALTRAESGAIRPKREAVDLCRLAEDVAAHLRVLADEKEQRLLVEAAEPVLADCDPAILRQGLTNILHNAIKYTPAGGQVRVAVTRPSAAEAAIEIRDSGPGIPPQHRARIFERFYRVDEGRARDLGGVGLGLAIARWAVEANGGRVELESAEGGGSLFRVCALRAVAVPGDGINPSQGSK